MLSVIRQFLWSLYANAQIMNCPRTFDAYGLEAADVDCDNCPWHELCPDKKGG